VEAKGSGLTWMPHDNHDPAIVLHVQAAVVPPRLGDWSPGASSSAAHVHRGRHSYGTAPALEGRCAAFSFLWVTLLLHQMTVTGPRRGDAVLPAASRSWSPQPGTRHRPLMNRPTELFFGPPVIIAPLATYHG